MSDNSHLKRKRAASRDIADVTISDHDTLRRWECDDDMLVDDSTLETDGVFIVPHPLKAGYMHWVLTPETEVGTPLTKPDLPSVQTLLSAAQKIVNKFSSTKACSTYLIEQQGEFGTDPRMGERWSGKEEAKRFRNVYGESEVAFFVGFEGFSPALEELQLHVVSKDLVYTHTAAEWNMFATEWGLLDGDVLAMMLEQGLSVAFPSAEDMGVKCQTTPIKSFGKDPLICATAASARKLSMRTLLGKDIVFAEDEAQEEAAKSYA